MRASSPAAPRRSAPSTRAELARGDERAARGTRHGRGRREGPDPSRPAGRAFRPLARVLHRRARRRAPLSRLFDPRSRGALDVRGDLLPAAQGRAADARRARGVRRRVEGGAQRCPAGILDIIRTVQATRIRWTCCAPPCPRSPPSIPMSADNSPEATLRKGVRLTSQVPMIVAAHEAHPPRPRAARARSAPLARRQLPADADRQGAERRRRAADGRRHDPARRARLERLGVHGARGRRHQGQPARGDDRGDRRAVRPVARRRGRERDADGAGDRRAPRRRPTT